MQVKGLALVDFFAFTLDGVLFLALCTGVVLFLAALGEV